MHALTDPVLRAGDLALTLAEGILTLWDAGRGQRLAIIPLAGCHAPWLDGGVPPLRVAGIERSPERLVVRQTAPGLEVRSEWRQVDGHLEFGGSFTTATAAALDRLDLLPAGSTLNLWDVVNYRNRHHAPEAWPELLLGGAGCATDTASGDWQFAPHPAMLVLRKGEDCLLVGALEVGTHYGMHLKAAGQRVVHWHLDHGGAGHGEAVAAGATVAIPRFALILERGAAPEAGIARWTGLLEAQGAIPDPALRVHHAWHREPLYCTWIDQCARAELVPAAELQDQATQAAPAIRILDQALVREALAVIRRERLPIRSILIDDGWAVARGDWRAHPQRFPDLRGLVDEIHAAGMKALVWWGWPEIATEAVVDPRLLIAGGRANRHGARMYDFASPVVQRDYLAPLFRTLFSDAPGCYDLDGIKTDFMADKVHPDMPPGDPAWRGEENFFVRFYRHLHAEMRRHKPDACHIGCSGHPWLIDAIDINRTFDVFGSDVREHAARGRMLAATAPGCPVALDFHNFRENLDAWFALGHRAGWSFQIGNVLAMRQDPFAAWEPADAAYHAQLRRGLAQPPAGATSS